MRDPEKQHEPPYPYVHECKEMIERLDLIDHRVSQLEEAFSRKSELVLRLEVLVEEIRADIQALRMLPFKLLGAAASVAAIVATTVVVITTLT